MIVAGRVSQKMAPVLRQVYDQMMEPKWVISMGVCASTGGMFNNYALVQGVDQVVPVDVYAPGCPPTPETLLHAIETLHQLIEDGELMKRRRRRARRQRPRHRDPVVRPAGAGPAREQVTRDRHRRGTERVDASPTRLSRPSCTAARASRAAARSSSTRRASRVHRRRQGADRRRLHDVRRPHRRSTTSRSRAARCRPGSTPSASRSSSTSSTSTPAGASGCACRCPPTTRRCRRCSTSTPAPRRWSARRTTCSASRSPTTPTCRAS